MKQKPKAPPKRNPFVALAHRRKAGSHRKPEKALRRAHNVAAQKGSGVDLAAGAAHFGVAIA